MSASESVLERLNETRSRLDKRFSDFEKSLYQKIQFLPETETPPHKPFLPLSASLLDVLGPTLKPEKGHQPITEATAKSSLKDAPGLTPDSSPNSEALEKDSVPFVWNAARLEGVQEEAVRLRKRIQELETQSKVEAVQLKEKIRALETQNQERAVQSNEKIREFETQNKNLEKTVENLRESLKVLTKERKEFSDQLHQLEGQSEDFHKSHAQNLDQLKLENVRLREALEQSQARRDKSAHFWRSRIKIYRLQKKLWQNEGFKSEECSKQNAKLMCELDAAHELIAELRDELHALGDLDKPQGK